MIYTTADIFNILQAGNPISLIRSGDGEQIVLNALNDLQSLKTCIDNVMKRQMGYDPTVQEVEAIRNNLIESYKRADIVGVPMHKNLPNLGKHWTSVESTVKPFCSTDKFTSTDICYDMLYEGLLAKWLQDKPVVNYISCRDIDEPLKRAFNIGQVNSYIIAPEAKFTSGYEGKKHYPEQFNEMEWWMSKCAIEGNPCLVGAGVIGKIYCNWFRDRGGIAIDIGAVFDLLAGFSTRGPLRGLDVKNEKYKL